MLYIGLLLLGVSWAADTDSAPLLADVPLSLAADAAIATDATPKALGAGLDVELYGSGCTCGSPCLTGFGGFGICQANGRCANNIIPPNCDGNCGNCGDPCTRSGLPGFCGVGGVCRIGLTRPPCGNNCRPPICPLIFCSGPQTTPTDHNGCPLCPICGVGNGGFCLTDANCPAGQECAGSGLLRRCRPRISRTCRPWLLSSSTTDVALSADSSDSLSDSSLSASASLLYPGGWNRCPSGQVCINGECVPCPIVDCIPPPCPFSLIPQTLSNGCPGCPRCPNTCFGSNCWWT